MDDNKQTSFWAIVEIMGHKRYAGHVSEEVVGGASFVRVDVPAGEGRAAFSKLFGAQAIYCITPVSETAAKAAASKLEEQPLAEWDLPDEWRQAIRQGQLTFEPSVQSSSKMVNVDDDPDWCHECHQPEESCICV